MAASDTVLTADAGVADAGSTSAGGADVSASAGVWAAAAQIGDQSATELAQLEQRKRELQAQREIVKRDLRNEQRKRVRLMERARGLSDTDLTTILATRAAAKAKAKANAKASAKAAA